MVVFSNHIITLFSGFVYSLIEYFNYNVITEIRFNEADSIEFPIITICNINKLSTDYSIEYLNKFISEDIENEYDVFFDDLKFIIVNSFAEDFFNNFLLKEKQKLKVY